MLLCFVRFGQASIATILNSKKQYENPENNEQTVHCL